MLNTRIFPSASGALPVELQSLGNDYRFACAIIGIAFTKLGDGVAKHGKDALGFEVPAQIPERALTKAGEAAHSDLHQSNLASAVVRLMIFLKKIAESRRANVWSKTSLYRKIDFSLIDLKSHYFTRN